MNKLEEGFHAFTTETWITLSNCDTPQCFRFSVWDEHECAVWSSSWFKGWYLMCSHSYTGLGQSCSLRCRPLIMTMNNPHCSIFSAIRSRSYVERLMPCHYTTVDFNLCVVFYADLVADRHQDMPDITIFLALNKPSNKVGSSQRHCYVYPSFDLCPQRTSAFVAVTRVGWKYLQWAVMYTRRAEEGTTCGWWPAEAPDVQQWLGRVPCCVVSV